MAEIYNKGGTDKTVILGIREFCAQPIQAPDWKDLRVGWFLSVTDKTDDDDTTGLGEVITDPGPGLPDTDRVRIGLTDRATGTVFVGYTNRASAGNRPLTPGTSELVTSDIGIGTTNANFWRPKNGNNNNFSFQISDQNVVRAQSADGSQIHFAQDATGAGGYATLLTMRLTRAAGPSSRKIISVSIKKATGSGHSGDVLFNNTPTKAILQDNLEGFPTTVQLFGPVTLTQEPDALFLYWPFRDSRLRIHAMGILKAG